MIIFTKPVHFRYALKVMKESKLSKSKMSHAQYQL